MINRIKKSRVPRKVKKEWKKDPYYDIYGRIWKSEYIWNNYEKQMNKIFNIKIASVRDTGKPIQGTYKGTQN